MKLLLKEDVQGLGDCGDEVEVRDGYGRNFLIPQGKAIMATPKNLKQFSHQKSIVQGRLKKIKVGADSLAQEIEKVTCAFKKKAGQQGKLFGAVTTQEISENLRAQGIELDRRKIQLKEPIKALGDFEVSVKLHPEVTVKIKITVAEEAAESSKEPEPVKEDTAS
ncbi:50S ribosomal protein L9 [Candidatus Nitromaritima sp. SCGC AAA799-A02]|nr:50S ribosomal protein L9 [Candidatus Nitromaritima sp. SCGC AAA799-A02]KMP12366.1 50S ribosomal protein L9 [Candidatus Nitromaritima sp. SCGC AAA799-C22]